MPLLESRLTGLSTELLRKVGVFCAGPSLIAFGSTCRSIQSACNDALVFQDSIGIQLNEKSSAPTPTADTQIEALKVRTSGDKRLWARYAVALSRLACLPDMSAKLSGSEELRDETLRRTMAFMPQMLALGCTSAAGDRTASLLTAAVLAPPSYSAPKIDQESLSKLAFCFASESVAFKGYQPSESAENEQLETALWAIRVSLVNDLKIDPQQIFQNQHQQYFLLGLFSRVLRLQGNVTPDLALLPLLSLEDAAYLPLPLGPGGDNARSEWTNWIRHTSSRYSRKGFMEDGEWCGYLSNDPYLLSSSGLLEGIHMKVDERDESFVISSPGREKDRTFTLDGIIRKADCQAEIKQEYRGLQTCLWRGSVTPFGIFGFWHAAHDVSEPLGLFWVWKKEWMNAE